MVSNSIGKYWVYTANSRLGLHLPHKVKSKQSKAKWISDIEELHITLVLDREYDFINQWNSVSGCGKLLALANY